MAANNFRLERITSERSLDLFASDSGYLDFFLQKEALLHEVNDWSRTYLLIDADAEDPNDAVAGYFTLRAESQWTTGLPTENDDAPRLLPVAELALLARHRRFRGQGVGSVLLSQVFRVVVAAADQIGIAGIYLSATSEGMRLYERFGFALFAGGGKRMFLPIKTVRTVAASVAEGTA